MKKFLLLLAVVLTFALTACDPAFYYNGPHFDLYTQITFSGLGVAGCGPAGYSPRVEVIEEDGYGRKLFIYEEDGLIYTDIMGERSFLCISQASDGKSVYYYPDFNFIIAPKASSMDISNFDAEAVDGLKALNDWGAPVNKAKCVKSEIVQKKPYKSASEKTEEHFREIFDRIGKANGYTGKSRLYSGNLACCNDADGRTLYFAYGRAEDHNNGSYFCLAVIFNADGTYDKERGVMELKDYYNYQQSLKAFKLANGWADNFADA